MKKIYEYFCKAEVGLCGVGFVLLIILVFSSAILRFLSISMSWNIDLAMLLLAWTSFLGADIAWRSGQLIGIDLVTRFFPKKMQKVIMLLIYAVILCVCVLICIYGARLVWVERLRTYQSMPIPYSLVSLSLVVATFSMSISTIGKIRDTIRYFNKNEVAASDKKAVADDAANTGDKK
ncbi:MAG: TRAP transporter small permease subunit [Treponemataceae bacterium]|nr:TRAP transporter small permease subunit [Treponemataceae bacterium]